MERPWIAETSIEPALACALIEEQFPALAPARLEPLGSGWDNDAFLVESAPAAGGAAPARHVFRFPRRALAVAWIETESSVLPVLAPRLPLPVPDPVHVGRPGRGYAWPWAGYAYLPGRTACRARLDAARRGRAAAPLGRFLRALHDVPAELARERGAGPDEIGRLDVARRSEQALERLAAARDAGLVDDLSPWEPVLSAAPSGPSGPPRVVHGDLYARHLLVDERGQLCGVIDWGDVHLGDPAVDLGIAHGFLPPGARADFLRAYGSVDDVTWRLARFRALHSAAMVLAYGHDVGDRALVDEGLTALRFLREEGGA